MGGGLYVFITHHNAADRKKMTTVHQSCCQIEPPRVSGSNMVLMLDGSSDHFAQMLDRNHKGLGVDNM